MAQIKLIATDLDGTFLQEGDTPHPENIQAVKRCHEAGIKVCAFTGRNWSWTKHIYQQAGFDRFCVLCNGSAIYDVENQEMRYRNRFDPGCILASFSADAAAVGDCVAVGLSPLPQAARPSTSARLNNKAVSFFIILLLSSHLHLFKISYISSWVSFLQQPAVMFVEFAMARKSVSSGTPNSLKVVGSPISLINAVIASMPANAASSSLSFSMFHTVLANRAKRGTPGHHSVDPL